MHDIPKFHTKLALLFISNDPGEVESNCFCFTAMFLSPYIHRERINLHKGHVRNKKKHLHSILEGCFYVLKDFDQSQQLQTIAKKSLQFHMFPT